MRKTHRLKEDFFILQSEGVKNSDSVLVKMTVTASENGSSATWVEENQ